MKYDRTVIGYHGCAADVAEQILAGESFKVSRNPYDWLGEGIYFWEFGFDRALQWAEAQQKRRKGGKPAVVGAIVQLGSCFDLMDTQFTEELSVAHDMLERLHESTGQPMPQNEGKTADKIMRHLDCAVLNLYFTHLERQGIKHDTVRCGFVEGGPAFPGSGIQKKSHVQLAVRNPRCIVGVFRPR